jgi:predicted N-acetyltransferase YhbS
MAELVPLSAIAPEKVEALLDAAFGTDRHGRTAYRLRAHGCLIEDLSFAIVEKGSPIGSIQCWPVRIGMEKLVLVGPVAVHPSRQNEGHGRRLMHRMLAAAAMIGNPPMCMIGDPEYYNQFGFTAESTGSWSLPGPWEPCRLLARRVGSDDLPKSGMIEEDVDAL